jgi:hypothetical protein
MKIKLVNLIEAVIISNPPSAFGTPTNSYRQPAVPSAVPAVPSAVPATAQPAKPFNPAQPFGQPVIPSAPKSSGVYSPTPAPPAGIAAPTPAATTGTGSFILDNPPTAPTPQKPLPAGEAPAMLRPNFNPAQPFGQPVIPTAPAAKPGAEYSPTPGSVKPKNPTVVQVPPAPVNTPKEPGMSQEDLERDADKWAQKPAATTAPAQTTSTPKQPKDTRSEHEKFMQRTSERLQRDQLRRQGEIEAASHSARLSRIGRSTRRVFEQQDFRFKTNALKSLLPLQEGGVVDAASALWDATKQYGKDVYNQGFGAATQKALGKIASSTVKGIEDATGTEYFTKGAIHPNIAAREFVNKITKETPGEPALNLVKNLTRYSPQTLARMQAGRYARAAAFTPEEAEEKFSHYAKMAALTNPLTYGGALAAGIGSALSSSAVKAAAPAIGSAIGGTVGGAIGTGVAGLAGLAGLAVGGAGKVAQKLANPYLAQQARETGKLIAARKDDWRYAAL